MSKQARFFADLPPVPSWGPVLERLPETPVAYTIAGEYCEGRADAVRIPSATFSRETFQRGKYTFSRVTLTNTGRDPVEPEELVLFQSGAFDWDGVPDSEWMAYLPARTSAERGHVRKIAELPDRMAVHDRELVQEGHAGYGDPFLLLSNGKRVLLIGFLENDRLLAEVQIRRSGGHLNRLRAVAPTHLFRLAPGKSVTSPLAVTFFADTAEQAVTEFIGLLKKHRGLPEPRRTPFVVSSWHYYGLEVSEKTVETELAAIQQRQIPAEVYQIDGGWYDFMGDWNADPVRFPHGMKYIAEKIRAAGLIPGLWFAGFQAARESRVLREHPDWVLRHADGTPVEMHCSQNCCVLDFSRQEVIDYVSGIFRKFIREYGFGYIKVDFSRRIFGSPDALPADPEQDLLELWNKGFKAIRQAVGKETFFLNCGGHPSAGLAVCDSLKGGSDTYACWHLSNGSNTGEVLKSYTSRFWETLLFHSCGTALNFWICDKIWDNVKTGHKYLRLGCYSDLECRTMAAAAFTTGGLVQTGSPLTDLPEKRLLMMTKVVPSIDRGSMRLNLWAPEDAVMFFRKDLDGLAGKWKVLTLLNLEDKPQPFRFELGGDTVKDLTAREFLVLDMDRFENKGVFRAGAEFDCGVIEPHGSRVLLVFPLPEPENVPFFVAGDVHYSGGAEQVQKISVDGKRLSVTLTSRWHKQAVLLGGIRENGCYRFLTAEAACGAGPVTGSMDFYCAGHD